MNEIVNKPLGSGVMMASGGEGFSVTPQTLNDVVEFARFMCLSNAGIPQYLRGNAPDCAAITMQALKWGFDPFSVAQKSYKVKDVLAYEAQLIAAVVNTRSGIKGRLKYAFDGEGNALTCTVTGILDGEGYSYTSPPVGSITTKNSPLWKTDPQQQLGYYSARSWARRYTPEVLLGVYDRDEAEEFRGPDNAKDITPERPSVMDRLKAAQAEPQQAQSEREGFNRDFVHSETESHSSGFSCDFSDDEPTLDLSPSDDAASASAASTEGTGGDDLPASASSVPSTLINHLQDFARKGFKTLSDDIDRDAKTTALDLMFDGYKGLVETGDISAEDWPKFESIVGVFRAVFTGKKTVDEGRNVVATDFIGCKVSAIGG